VITHVGLARPTCSDDFEVANAPFGFSDLKHERYGSASCLMTTREINWTSEAAAWWNASCSPDQATYTSLRYGNDQDDTASG